MLRLRWGRPTASRSRRSSALLAGEWGKGSPPFFGNGGRGSNPRSPASHSVRLESEHAFVGLSYGEAEARDAVAASMSVAETLRRLGLCDRGAAPALLKKHLVAWDVSTEHFDRTAGLREASRRGQRPLDELLTADTPVRSAHLKVASTGRASSSRRASSAGKARSGAAGGWLSSSITSTASEPTTVSTTSASCAQTATQPSTPTVAGTPGCTQRSALVSDAASSSGFAIDGSATARAPAGAAGTAATGLYQERVGWRVRHSISSARRSSHSAGRGRGGCTA